jgi:hypothetical protein
MIPALADLQLQLVNIVQDRFASLPPSIRSELIGDKRRIPHQYTVLDDNYILVVLHSHLRGRQIQKRESSFGQPFPGLLTTTKDNFRIAVTLDRAQRIIVSDDVFTGFDFCFLVGKDCTRIIEHLEYTPYFPKVKTTIPLAYAVSFGAEITRSNCAEYFDDLLVYHINDFRMRRRETANAS